MNDINTVEKDLENLSCEETVFKVFQHCDEMNYLQDQLLQSNKISLLNRK